MSVDHFKGGAVYFNLSFLVGKAFKVTIWRKESGYSFLIFRSSKLDFM